MRSGRDARRRRATDAAEMPPLVEEVFVNN
jgi:hypothetical protein